MNATNRIYRPGQQVKVDELSAQEMPHSSAVANGAGHSDMDVIPPFPLDCFPPDMANMARAIAHTERTPEALAGCCVLGMVSASIGAGLQITSGPNRVTRGNLYLMGSADSGSGKSETFRHAVKPLQELERAAVERWRTEIKPKVDAEKAILESRITQLKRDAGHTTNAIEREALRGEMELATADLMKVEADCYAPVLSVEDVTTERLAVMLAQNDEQLASISADAGSIVNNLLGRYNKLYRTDEAIYLKAFSGDYCRVDRQGRDPVTLQRPCLSSLWLVQPDKVETLLAERSLTDGGLIPRFLVCHTRAQPRPEVDDIQGIPPATKEAWYKRVQQLVHTFRLAHEPVTIEPTPEARLALRNHYNRIVEKRLGDLRDVGTYAARWNEQAWRIGVCLHAALYGENAGAHPLSVDTAASAIALANWFAGEQLRILARGRHAARHAIQNEVLALLADTPKGITARDVYRARIVDTADEAHTLLAQMETDRELNGSDSKPETGGHVTRIFIKAQK